MLSKKSRSADEAVLPTATHPGWAGAAAAPRSRLSLRDWATTAIRVVRRIMRDNVSMLAAGVAFYVFVAIPASLTVIISLYGLAFGPWDVDAELMPMAGLLPGDVISVISDLLKATAAHPHATLGAGLALALLVALWSAQSATAAMITSLDLVYEETETRGVIRFQATAFAMALGVFIFAVVALSLLGLLPAAMDASTISLGERTLIDVARWVLLVFLVIIAIGGIYRFAPDRDVPAGRQSAPGILAAATFCMIDSWLFSLYVTDFASYDQRYGSLGAVIVLLLWLYLAVFAILVGAALNFELDHRLDARS